MPANLMSIDTSRGPGSRRVMVVLISGSVAEVAAYAETVRAETVLMAAFFSSCFLLAGESLKKLS